MGAFDVAANITIPDPNNPEEAEAFRKKWGWEPHEQVLLCGTYTAGHMEAVTNASVHSNMTGQSAEITLQSGTGRMKLLECMILNWTFLRDGNHVPVNPNTIRQLPYNYMEPILERCDKLAGTMKEQAQTDFLTSANGHIVDSSESANLSLMKS